MVEGIEIIGVNSLKETCDVLCGRGRGTVVQLIKGTRMLSKEANYLDFSDIKGQQFVKRAVEIAVAGHHNLLMIGPPGAGKTAIAKRIPSILPPLTLEESLELTMLYSIVGQVEQSSPLKTERPFREVHQNVTQTALMGGGVFPKPGEISMAHKGVLFLDEIAEFPKSILENLRQPMEEHKIKIVREKGECEFPAEFLLVAAMNPCPCGNYPDLNLCTCTKTQIQAYMGKLSQPLLERIDICVEVPKVEYSHLTQTHEEENSETIRERIIKAREVQNIRYHGQDIMVNAHLNMKNIEKYCRLGKEGCAIMEQAYAKLGLTARTYHKVLAVARTIADLDGEDEIQAKHLREALSFRVIDTKKWG